MKKNLKNKKKGFTLIELIIVIAIIAIIAAIAIPKFGDVRRNAALNSDIANAKNIANAVTMAIAEDKGAFPSNTTDKRIPITKDNLGEYLQSIPTPSAGGSFYVEIRNGDVIVFTAETGDNQVYPEK